MEYFSSIDSHFLKIYFRSDEIEKYQEVHDVAENFCYRNIVGVENCSRRVEVCRSSLLKLIF